ncbi:MAG: O-antigen ligase family protein [Gemmatimonadales bacterium]
MRTIPIVTWALCLLSISIPLEAPDQFVVEVTAMTGALVVLATAFDLRGCYARLPWPAACYALYLAALAVSFILQGGTYPAGTDLGQVGIHFLRLLTWLLLFWACTNLLRDERNYRAGLWSLVFGCLIRAVLPLVGFARSTSSKGAERVAALGQDPNQSAQVLAMGLLALIGLVFLQPKGPGRFRIFALGGCALLAVGIVQTGSRGGFATACIGGMIYLATGKSLRLKVRNAAIGLVMLLGLGVIALQSDTMRARVEKTFQPGDAATPGSLNLAGREIIWPIALGMFRQKPLLGWGPVTNKQEVGLRLRDPEEGPRDTHDLLLEILTASGLAGALPFIAGTWLCVLAAWRARKGHRGAVPLAMLLAILAGNITQNRLTWAVLWLMLAYAAASLPDPDLADQASGTGSQAPSGSSLTGAPITGPI